MNFRNLCVIGVGGVGGFFGGPLCMLRESPEPRHVSFVARGDNLRAIRDRGLRLDSEQGGSRIYQPSLATDDLAAVPDPDLVLLCVKEFDLDPVLARLAGRMREDTVVIPLLNGMDIRERVRGKLSNGVVLPACVYVGTHLAGPGHVRQGGGACRILTGPDPDRPGFQPDAVLGVLREAGVKVEWTPGIESEIWQKFIFIAAFGLVTAVHDRPLGDVLADPSLLALVRGVMTEAVGLARAVGTALPPDIIERSVAKGRTFPPDARTSFQRDFARPDRKDERDLFAGSLLRLARRLGRDVPTTEGLAGELARRKPVLGNG